MRFVLTVTVSADLCEEIAQLRRKIQVVGREHVVFLDETAMRVSEAATHTLVLPDEEPYVHVEDTTSYAKRYDMIACCTYDRVLPPIIYPPSERAEAGVKGINTRMLLQHIESTLAQACGSLDRYPLYLIVDKSTIHNKEEILQAFQDNGCQDMVDVWKMPTQAAKRMSPLDNALFHDWKERVRKRAAVSSRNIIQLMADEWNNLPPHLLHSHFQHCGLLRWQQLYADCPAPAQHVHDS